MAKTNTPKFAKGYQKSDVFEKALDIYNNALSEHKDKLELPLSKDITNLHIIGAPRSGTTLLSQVLISALDLGYINNFIATSWKAPVFGVHLSKKLLGADYTSNLNSDFGRTNSIMEPHEFGYFWKDQLNYNDFLQRTYDTGYNINWSRLKNSIYQIGMAFEKPVLFKSFLYGFHAKDAVNHMPNSLFIFIERSVIDNAVSILKFRRTVFGDESFWASIKPHQYTYLKGENIYRQIIGQIECLNYEYKKQLEQLDSPNYLKLTYDELCNNYEGVISSVKSKIMLLSEEHLGEKKVKLAEIRKANVDFHSIKDEKGFKDAQKWFSLNKNKILNP